MAQGFFHESAIAKVIAKRPEPVNTHGLNKFARRLFKKIDIPFSKGDVFDGCAGVFCRNPDAWSYEPWQDPKWPGTFNIFEIEDGYPIRPEKLRDYAESWLFLDGWEVGLRLFVYDRFGENERELSLRDYWFMFLQKEVRERA